ncbi:MAG: hypothetical protein U5K69_19805 [Balneolaceae bacterium]|nr:hypothetical protein [Balneolaceae bacterium]
MIPNVIKEIIEQSAFEARDSEYIDQKSGVSTRMTITAMEQSIPPAGTAASADAEQKPRHV